MSADHHTDSISSWFVRRKASADADSKQHEQQQQQQQQQQKGSGRGKEKEAAATAGHAGAEQAAGDKKPRLQAAAEAVAAVVHPERKAKPTAGAEAEAGGKPAEQQRRRRRRRSGDGDREGGAAGSASSSDGGSDSEGEHFRAAARREGEAQHAAQQGTEHAEGNEQKRHAAVADEEAEDRPRIMAYSDSDSDVESHFKRVAHHLLPPSKEEVEAEAAAAEAAAAAQAAAEAQAVAARRAAPLRRLGGAAAGATSALAPHLTPGMAARAGGLLLLGRVHPTAARMVSALGVAAPLVGAAAARAGWDLGAVLPRPLAAAGRELGQVGKVALAITAARLLHAGAQRQRRRRRQLRSLVQPGTAAAGEAPEGAAGVAVGQPVGTSSGRLLRRRSSVNLAALVAAGDLSNSIRLLNPESSAEWAAVYASEMRELRRMLQENQVELPADRFDASNAELLRFAKACGLLNAKTPEARAAAVEAAFSRVVHTADWASRHRFMTDRELRRWDRLAAWKAHDASGRPILLARLGRAQQLIKPERCEEFVNALVSLVHRGMTTHLSSANGGTDQMVVMLDCRGGSSMGMARHMGLLKKFVVAMTQHYPDRLFRLHLLELPLLLRWALHAVIPLLHPATRAKMVLSSISDPELPVTVAFLTKRRSTRTPLQRSMSHSSFPSSGDSTPALLSPQPSHLAAITSGVPAAACAALQQQQEQEQRQPLVALGEEEVPHTPPPMLKAPQSPLDVAAAGRSRRLSLERVALHARQQQAQQQGEQQGQAQQQHHHQGALAGPPRPLALHARSHQQTLHMPRHPLAHHQGQAPASAPPAVGSSRAAGLEAPASPFASRTPQQCQQAWATGEAAAAVPVALEQPAADATNQPAAAAVQATAASAAAGPSSHAVPWSPGMQSPGGTLSRDSSYGDEVVPAARAKAAADAVREHELATAAGASPASGALPLLSPVAPAQPQQQPAAEAQTSGSSGTANTLAGLSGLLTALLPAAARSSVGGGGEQAPAAGEQTPPRRRRSLLAHRIPSFSSRDASPATPASARRRGGLMDLPERRYTPARGITPRKSSLRRSESADSLSGDGRRQPLGSHPLRRQSSVSWAEELESIKEIQASEGSPSNGAHWSGYSSPTALWRHVEGGEGFTLRVRLAAAGQHPAAVLSAGLLMMIVAVLLQRLLFSAGM